MVSWWTATPAEPERYHHFDVSMYMYAVADVLTPSQEEQSSRSLEDEKLSDETPSEGGRSSGLPRAGAGALMEDDSIP